MRQSFKHAAFGLSALISTSLPNTALAGNGEEKDIRAHLIIDGQSGEVLQSYKPNERRYPASITKMLTLTLLLDHMHEKVHTTQKPIQVSKRAAATPPSGLKLKTGEQLSYEMAINAILIKSANDVAVAIAEHVGGSVENFANMMNLRAKNWGMDSSHFTNPSGLPNKNHYTTACDMTKMTLHILNKYPEIKDYPTVSSFNYNDQEYGPYGTMRKYYPFVDLYKAGFINASQKTLIASAKRDGHRVVGAKFGVPKNDSIYWHMSWQFNKLYKQQVETSVPERVDPKVIYPAELLSCKNLSITPKI